MLQKYFFLGGFLLASLPLQASEKIFEKKDAAIKDHYIVVFESNDSC